MDFRLLARIRWKWVLPMFLRATASRQFDGQLCCVGSSVMSCLMTSSLHHCTLVSLWKRPPVTFHQAYTSVQGDFDAELRNVSGSSDLEKLWKNHGDSLNVEQMMKLLCSTVNEAQGKSDKLVMDICVKLLCHIGSSFKRAEETAKSVSRLPSWFISSVAFKLVSSREMISRLNVKKTLLRSVAEEVVAQENGLTLREFSFLVSCIVRSGYKDDRFGLQVKNVCLRREIVSIGVSFKDLGLLLFSLTTCGINVHDLLMAWRTKLIGLVGGHIFPQGVGELLRHYFKLKVDVDEKFVLRLLDLAERSIGCLELCDVVELLVHIPLDETALRATNLLVGVMKNFRVDHRVSYAMITRRHILVFFLYKLCKQFPEKVSTFEEHGVFDAVHVLFMKNVRHHRLETLGWSLHQLSVLNQCKPSLLSTVAHVIVTRKEAISASNVFSLCWVYGLSSCSVKTAVMSALGERLTSESWKSLTNEEITFLPYYFTKARVFPLLEESCCEGLVVCVATFSSQLLKQFCNYWLMLCIESVCIAEQLVDEVEVRLGDQPSSVSPKLLMNVTQYASLCSVPFRRLVSHLRGSTVTDLYRNGLLRDLLPVIHLNDYSWNSDTVEFVLASVRDNLRLLSSERLANLSRVMSSVLGKVCGGSEYSWPARLVCSIFVHAVAVFDESNRPVKIESDDMLRLASVHCLRPLALLLVPSKHFFVNRPDKLDGIAELRKRALERKGWNVILVNLETEYKKLSEVQLVKLVRDRVTRCLQERYSQTCSLTR